LGGEGGGGGSLARRNRPKAEGASQMINRRWFIDGNRVYGVNVDLWRFQEEDSEHHENNKGPQS